MRGRDGRDVHMGGGRMLLDGYFYFMMTDAMMVQIDISTTLFREGLNGLSRSSPFRFFYYVIVGNGRS